MCRSVDKKIELRRELSDSGTQYPVGVFDCPYQPWNIVSITGDSSFTLQVQILQVESEDTHFQKK